MNTPTNHPKVLDTREGRAFVRAGFHRLYCTPYSTNTEGPKKGRQHHHEELLPAYGAEGCFCHTLTVKVNGEVV